MDTSNHKHSRLGNHPFSRRSTYSFSESWTVANHVLFRWIRSSSQHRVSFHTCLLERADTLLSIVRTVSFSLDLPLAAPEASLSSCLSRQGKCFSRFVCFRYRTTIFLVWCSLAIHLCEYYLECSATAMALAALTVEADDDTKCPEPRHRFFINLLAC